MSDPGAGPSSYASRWQKLRALLSDPAFSEIEFSFPRHLTVFCHKCILCSPIYSALLNEPVYSGQNGAFYRIHSPDVAIECLLSALK